MSEALLNGEPLSKKKEDIRRDCCEKCCERCWIEKFERKVKTLGWFEYVWKCFPNS